MAELFVWIEDFFSFTIATIGTTDVSLGLLTAFGLIASLVMGIRRKAAGRG